MKKLIDWAKGFLSENGEASSKRLVGVVCAFFLCYTLFANHDTENKPAESLVYAVASLSAAALGLSSIEKVFKKGDNSDSGSGK